MPLASLVGTPPVGGVPVSSTSYITIWTYITTDDQIDTKLNLSLGILV